MAAPDRNQPSVQRIGVQAEPLLELPAGLRRDAQHLHDIPRHPGIAAARIGQGLQRFEANALGIAYLYVYSQSPHDLMLAGPAVQVKTAGLLHGDPPDAASRYFRLAEMKVGSRRRPGPPRCPRYLLSFLAAGKRARG